jgi:hypothetical protein
MRGHVFIVNQQTLPKHLEYMFVGVSAGKKKENISLLADMKRVKKDDFIFFYIEGTQKIKGRFFGIFQARDNEVYYLSEEKAKEPSLPKPLIYRKFIKPYEIYPKGVLEWVALDKLPIYAREILWSLIYRKMKGKRGNTMLFPWETERLITLIQEANDGEKLNGKHFSFCSDEFIIVATSQTNKFNLENPVFLNFQDAKKSETAFQAFILQELKTENNNFYPEIFGKNITWIGNEVFAGSGMQKIDLMTIEKINQTKSIFRIIELKHPTSKASINFAPEQLEYYINWALEDIGGHLKGAKKFNIKPILLVFTYKFNSIIPDVVKNIAELKNISFEPEIWEVNFEGKTNKIL